MKLDSGKHSKRVECMGSNPPLASRILKIFFKFYVQINKTLAHQHISLSAAALLLLFIPLFSLYCFLRPSMSMPPISPSLSRPLFSLSSPSGSCTHPHGCEHADPASTLFFTTHNQSFGGTPRQLRFWIFVLHNLSLSHCTFQEREKKEKD